MSLLDRRNRIVLATLSVGAVVTVQLGAAAAYAAPLAPAGHAPRCDGKTVTKTVSKRGTFRASKGSDVILIAGRHVTVRGNGGNDRICGSRYDDVVAGGDGNDIIYGYAGNDTLTADAGNDIIHGGTGNDKIFGGAGHDKLFGDAGNDTLTAYQGKPARHQRLGLSELNGGPGNDLLVCGSGPCIAVGGGGNDTGKVGTGSSTFVHVSKLILPPKHGVFTAPAGIPVYSPTGALIGIVGPGGKTVVPTPAPPLPPVPPVVPPVGTPTPPPAPVLPPVPPVSLHGISGTISDASTGDPLYQAVVTIFPAGNPTASTAVTVGTGPSGTYSVSGLTPGAYTVQASAKKFALRSLDVTVAGSDLRGVNLALEPASSGSGGDETVIGTVTDEEGNPLADIPVVGCAAGSTEEEPGEGPEETCGDSAETTTDEHGHYALEGLPSGAVSIQVNPQLLPSSPSEEGDGSEEGELEFNPAYSDDAATLELEETEAASHDVALRPAGAITGTVVYDSSDHLPPVVFTTDDQGLLHYSEVENGAYVIEGLATGDYQLTGLTVDSNFSDTASGTVDSLATADTTTTAPDLLLHED